ncbi:MAG: hypothetical protein R2788_03455 [Saprospiraceae bacterium]
MWVATFNGSAVFNGDGTVTVTINGKTPIPSRFKIYHSFLAIVSLFFVAVTIFALQVETQ